MKEDNAKKQLGRMLRSLTAGSILGLLAELFKESAEEARQDNDAVAYEQRKLTEHTLIVVGLGIDAICPR
jgi:hypothetical protein